MPTPPSWNSDALDRAGLNLQAVFDLDALPASLTATLRAHFDPAGEYRQLILLGHGGTALWQAVQAAAIAGPDPIDSHSAATARAWFAQQFPTHRSRLIYPGDGPIGLQALGALAGWHHPSPFRVGINARWGTWFAYRAVLLSDTALPASAPLTAPSPCTACHDKPCLAACPADALAQGDLSLTACIAYRRREGSSCATRCLARQACPVGSEHRYSDEQVRHSYSISLQAIKQYG